MTPENAMLTLLGVLAVAVILVLRLKVPEVTIVRITVSPNPVYNTAHHAVIEWSDGRTWEARGNCTVWYKYPTGERLGNNLSLRICNVQDASRFGAFGPEVK